MDRKTRSQKQPTAPVAPVTVGKKKGRKKKSETVEATTSQQPLPTPARRSTRGKVPTEQFQDLEQSIESFIIETNHCKPSDLSADTSVLTEDSQILEVIEIEDSSDQPYDETPMQPEESTSPAMEEEEIPVESKTENVMDDPEIVLEVESDKPTTSEDSLLNIEQKMSDVVIDESDQKESLEIVTKVEEKTENTEPEDVEMVEMKDSVETEIVEPEIKPEVKVDIAEASQISEEAYINSLMDVEDVPFIRRSRRLKSTQIEPVIKMEEPAPPSSDIVQDTAAINADLTSSKISDDLDSKKVTEIQQEMIVKSVPEIQVKVENHDVRLQRYETILENIYSKKSDKKVCKVNKTMKCDCTITEVEIAKGELGCQYNCINRILYIECGLKCRCGAYCDNQQFQRYNYSSCSVFETTNKGFGIRADNDIPAETFIMEYVGEVLDNKQFEKRAKKYSENKNIHYYFMALKSNAIIDATKKGNISRFINHSCDPNAETQKWTVNGELRVGFFSRKDIKQGEEITFDYQYQRYGKEAQKCFCEAHNCRGWIGENPLEDEADEEEIVESPEIDDTKTKKTKSRKGRKPKVPQDKTELETEIKDESSSDEEAKISFKKLEAARKLALKLQKHQELYDDLELQGGINDLLESGLKNRAHTIRLSRLVVRAKNYETRSPLLKILIEGDLPCRRLFLDYNGLRLLHNWMCDIKVEKSIPDLKLCIQLMNVLDILPITNKTVLRTSKVLDRVEKWKNLDLEKKIEKKKTEKIKLTKEEKKQMKAEKKKNKTGDKKPETEIEAASEAAKDESFDLNMSDQAKENGETTAAPDENSTCELTELKIEVKKVASELLEKWQELKEDFKIPKKQKQEIMIEHEREADNDGWEDDSTVQRAEVLSSDRYKNRFGDDPAQSGGRAFATPYRKQFDPIVSKQQRRQQFEMKVAQFDNEKRMMITHENNCAIFGLNPHVTNPLDVPVRVNRVTGEYNTIDGRIAPPPPNHHQFKYEPMTLSTDPEDYILPHIDLPEHWKHALDGYGRIFYYHEKIRQPQWVAPIKILPLKIQAENDENSEEIDSDESTTDTEDSEEEELQQILEMLKRKKLLSPIEPTSVNNALVIPSCDGEEDELEKKIMSNMMKNPVEQPVKLLQKSQMRVRKKKRHGLASMQFIRPRTEADKIYGRSESKRYKEVKEQLRMKKRRILKGEAGPADDSDDEDDFALNDSIESSRCVDELDILEKSELENARNKIKKEAAKKVKPAVVEQKPAVVDQIEVKRQFRDEIRKEIGIFLQTYREDTCKSGRIMNDDDFSCLVNKLTYSILMKESKHCQATNSVLKATDSVKGKTKEFIKKYMAKFPGAYQRKEDEQDYATILNKI